MEFGRKKLITAPHQLVLCLAILGLFAVGEASADTSSGPYFAVAPHTFDLDLEKGQRYQDRIKVYNRGNFAIPFKIKVLDFDALDGSGEMREAEFAGQESSATSWFEFEHQDLVVEAQQKANLDFSIEVPTNAEPRGYYAIVMLEADISTLVLNESKLQVIPKLGALFLLKVGQQGQSAQELEIMEYTVIGEERIGGAEKVVNFFTKPFSQDDAVLNITATGEPTFLVKIKNNSAYHKKLAGSIDLSGLGWKYADQLNFEELTILPGRSRDVLVKGAKAELQQQAEKKEKGFGLLTADLEINTTEGLKQAKRRWVLVFSWQAAIIIILCLSLLFFGNKIARNKIQAIKSKSPVSPSKKEKEKCEQ